MSGTSGNGVSLARRCYALCLLPSRDLEASVGAIVQRQLGRPFARDRATEEAVIRERHPVYATTGDLVVYSTAQPQTIAEAVVVRLRC